MTMVQACLRQARLAAAALSLIVGCTIAAPALAAQAVAAPTRTVELDRVVLDLCQKQVVLLGEDAGHGGGRTIELKVELARRLMNECDFSVVMFESQIYDFLALDRSFATKSATPAQLADAIGGIWSTTEELDPLVALLFEGASAGKTHVSGLTPQVGGATQIDTRRNLAQRLTTYLRGTRRTECATRIHRLTNWEFDEGTHYDEPFREQIRACIADIQESVATRPASDSAAIVGMMAKNLSSNLDMSSEDAWNVRDRAMYENFAWLRTRLPSKAKIIIWTATIHAVKRRAPGPENRFPLGYFIHQSLGDRSAAIGFSALSGSYGRQGQAPTGLPGPTPDSLESRTLKNHGIDLQYIDRTQLASLGTIEARAINYAKPANANWAELLDGILVMREERPPHYVRSAVPRQTVELETPAEWK